MGVAILEATHLIQEVVHDRLDIHLKEIGAAADHTLPITVDAADHPHPTPGVGHILHMIGGEGTIPARALDHTAGLLKEGVIVPTLPRTDTTAVANTDLLEALPQGTGDIQGEATREVSHQDDQGAARMVVLQDTLEEGTPGVSPHHLGGTQGRSCAVSLQDLSKARREKLLVEDLHLTIAGPREVTLGVLVSHALPGQGLNLLIVIVLHRWDFLDALLAMVSC